jgi:beta-phosphoglucomutase-like phosphatase (HAD superfamily)
VKGSLGIAAGAICAYLAKHRLVGHIASVVGRTCADPAQMKPRPEPILRGTQILKAKPGQSVIIGDSASDIEGGKAAGVRVIGYANRLAKVDAFYFYQAGADVVVPSIGPITEVLIRRNKPTGVVEADPAE